MPFLVARFEDVELHERAGFGRVFPRRGFLAGAQADDGVAGAQRFARLHGEVTGDAVALVEQADDGDALRHGGAGEGGLACLDDVARHADRAVLIGLFQIVGAAAAGSHKQ